MRERDNWEVILKLEDNKEVLLKLEREEDLRKVLTQTTYSVSQLFAPDMSPGVTVITALLP